MSKAQIVGDNIGLGVYTWRVNGRPVMNENGDHLIAPARRGDKEAIRKLTEVVRSFGIYEGEPCFEDGVRPISQSEWEEQKARQLAGEVPDPYDLGNLIEEYKNQKEQNDN
jgi:hypothetical protein